MIQTIMNYYNFKTQQLTHSEEEIVHNLILHNFYIFIMFILTILIINMLKEEG
jgi:hypothetical protein